MSIEDWRRKIDEIDRRLVELFNERSQCAIEIGRIKHDQNLRVYDPEREREILFERVIDECRRIERLEREKKD
jgi:chorismate mutase